MATSEPGIDVSFTAAGTMAAKQFYIAKLSAARTVDVTTAATNQPIGVIQDNPASGAVSVRIFGIAKVVIGAAISTAGVKLVSDGSGRAITAAAGAGTNNGYLGFALETSGAAGDVISVFVCPGFYQG